MDNKLFDTSIYNDFKYSETLSPKDKIAILHNLDSTQLAIKCLESQVVSSLKQICKELSIPYTNKSDSIFKIVSTTTQARLNSIAIRGY